MSNVAAGKDTDDEGESINDVEKTLRNLDIKLRDSAGEWRSFEAVLDEVATKWNNGAFNEVEKSQIATAIAGVRQQENFRALMNNWDEVTKLTNIAADSTGSASEKMEIYLDSVEAKLKEVEAAWEEFILKLNQSDSFKGALDIVIFLIENLPTVINLIGDLFVAWKSWSYISKIQKENEAAMTMTTIAIQTQAMAEHLAEMATRQRTVAIQGETIEIQENTIAENANKLAGQQNAAGDQMQIQMKNAETAAIQANTAAIQANTVAENANQIAGQTSLFTNGLGNVLQGQQISLFSKKISGAKTLTGSFTKTVAKSSSALSSFSGMFAKLGSGISSFLPKLGKIGLAISILKTAWDVGKMIYDNVKNAQFESVQATKEAVEAIDEQSSTLEGLKEELLGAYSSTTSLEERTSSLKNIQDTLNNSFKDTIEELGETKTANDLLNNSYEETLGLLNKIEAKNIKDKAEEYNLGEDDRNKLLDDNTSNDLGVIGHWSEDTNNDGIYDRLEADNDKKNEVVQWIQDIVLAKGGRMALGAGYGIHIKTDEAETQVEIYREMMDRVGELTKEQQKLLGEMINHSSWTEKSVVEDAEKYGTVYDENKNAELNNYLNDNITEYQAYKDLLEKRKQLHAEYLEAETESEKQNLLNQIDELEPELKEKEDAFFKNTYGSAPLQNMLRDHLSEYDIDLSSVLNWNDVEGFDLSDWTAIQREFEKTGILSEELKEKILAIRDAIKAIGNEKALKAFDLKLKALGLTANDTVNSINNIRNNVINGRTTEYTMDESGNVTGRDFTEFEKFEKEEAQLLEHLKTLGVNFNEVWYNNLKEKFKNGEIDGQKFFDTLTTMAKYFGVDLENEITGAIDEGNAKKLELNYDNSGGTDSQFKTQMDEVNNLYSIAGKIDNGTASYEDIRHLTDNYQEFLDTVQDGNKITGKQVEKFADKMAEDINEDLDKMIENAEDFQESLNKIMSKGSKALTKDNDEMADSLATAMKNAEDEALEALKDENKELQFVDTTKVSGDLEMVKEELEKVETASDEAGAASQFFSSALNLANLETQQEILNGMSTGISGLSQEQWNAIYSSDMFQNSLLALTEQEGFLNSETHGLLMELGLVDEQGKLLQPTAEQLGTAIQVLSTKFGTLSGDAQTAAASILSAAYSQGIMNDTINNEAGAQDVINKSGKVLSTASTVAGGTVSEGWARKAGTNAAKNKKGSGSGSKYTAEDAASDLKDILQDIEGYEADIELDLEDQTEQFINQEMLAANRLDRLKEELDYYSDIYDVTEETSKWLETQNKILDNQSKKVGKLQQASRSIEAQREKLYSQNSGYNIKSWFDSEGNDTLAYGDLINSFAYQKNAIEKETAQKMREVYNSVAGSTNKEAIQDAKDKIKQIEEEADIRIEALDKEQEKIENIHDSVGELNEAWLDNQEAIREALAELHDKVVEIRDELLDDITEQLEKAVDKQNESLEKDATRIEQFITIQEKYNDILNETLDTQDELDSELRASLDSFEYLDEQMRELMFNEEDYKILSETLTGIQEDIADIWSDHYDQINSLTDEEMYKAEYITAETERQLEMKMKEYELAKAELEVAKARTNLQNVQNERNVRMFVGGQWQWVADPNAVKDAQQQLADAEREKDKIEREGEQQILIDKLNRIVDSDNLQIDKNNELLERIEEAIEAELAEVKNIEQALTNASGEDLPALNDVLQGAFGTDGGIFKELMNEINRGQTELALALKGTTIAQAEAQLKSGNLSQAEFDALRTKLGYGWDEKTGTITTQDGSFSAHYKGWKPSGGVNTPLHTGENGASVTGGGSSANITQPPAAAPSGFPKSGRVSTSSLPLRIRSGAGTNYKVLGSMPKGASVEILGEANSGWAKVRYKGISGYASKQYLTYDQGGLANGKGIFLKDINLPERVLSPQQTKSFDTLVKNLTTNPVLAALTKNIKGTSNWNGATNGLGETKQYYFSNFTVQADNITEFIDSIEGMMPIANK